MKKGCWSPGQPTAWSAEPGGRGEPAAAGSLRRASSLNAALRRRKTPFSCLSHGAPAQCPQQLPGNPGTRPRHSFAALGRPPRLPGRGGRPGGGGRPVTPRWDCQTDVLIAETDELVLHSNGSNLTVRNSILSQSNWTGSSSILSNVLINAKAIKPLLAIETARLKGKRKNMILGKYR